MPLPEKSTVEWYAKSLGKVLKVGDVEDITKRMQVSLLAWVQSAEAAQRDAAAAAAAPAPEPQGMTEEQFIAERESILSTEREIKLLAMATRLADDQTRRNIES